MRTRDNAALPLNHPVSFLARFAWGEGSVIVVERGGSWTAGHEDARGHLGMARSGATRDDALRAFARNLARVAGSYPDVRPKVIRAALDAVNAP